MDKQGFERLVGHLGDAWEERNAEAASTYFTQDAIYAELPGGRTIMGREAIWLHFEETAKEEIDPSFVVHKAIFCDDEGAVEWTYTYRSASTGKHEVYRGVALAEMEGDKFKSWREYGQRVELS